MVIIVEQLVEGTSGSGNRSTQTKRAPVPLCVQKKIPHDLSQA
jgi:hypothetical protein